MLHHEQLTNDFDLSPRVDRDEPHLRIDKYNRTCCKNVARLLLLIAGHAGNNNPVHGSGDKISGFNEAADYYRG